MSRERLASKPSYKSHRKGGIKQTIIKHRGEIPPDHGVIEVAMDCLHRSESGRHWYPVDCRVQVPVRLSDQNHVLRQAHQAALLALPKKIRFIRYRDVKLVKEPSMT